MRPVRGDTSPTPEYYNGVLPSSTVQNLKDKESAYFSSAGGYSSKKLPGVGDQIAAMNDVNTSPTVDALRKRYHRGDLVTAMVYNGTVYRKPDITLQLADRIRISNNINVSAPFNGHPVSFFITVSPRSPPRGWVFPRRLPRPW